MAHWTDRLGEKRRADLLLVLNEISRLRAHGAPEFVVIGAIPLLVRGYLEYRALWDVDLLFRDENAISAFASLPKDAGLRVVDYAGDCLRSHGITSYLTTWKFQRAWINVDLIARGALFEFFRSGSSPPWIETFDLGDRHLTIELPCAAAWDIFVDKVLSPRMRRDIEAQASISVDLRHVAIICQRDGGDRRFWEHVVGQSRRLGREPEFLAMMRSIIRHAARVGYANLAPTPLATRYLGDMR